MMLMNQRTILSSKVGNNSEHISKIESQSGKAETVVKTEVKAEPVVSKPVKEVKLDEVPDKPEDTDSLDFSDIIGEFMSSVST